MKPRLRHAEIFYSKVGSHSLAESVYLRYCGGFEQPAVLPPDPDPTGDAIEVYLNHGRWIAECPDCHTAVLASAEDPRFLCPNCRNIQNLERWRPLVWPRPDVVDQLEQVVMLRPESTTRNWDPSEAVEDLVAQNVERGDPIPESLEKLRPKKKRGR